MLPYLSILAFIPIASMILKPQHSKGARLLFCWIIFGILALLAMIRAYTVGIDTPQFIGAYQDIGFNSSFSLNQYRYEPGFTILCKLLNYVSNEPQLLLIVSGAFIMYAVGYTVYHLSRDVALSAFLFVSMTMYTAYLNVMRQAIAVGFILLGYCKLLDRRWGFAVCFFLSATLFHQSAWLVLFTLPLTFFRFNKKVLFTYLLSILVMCIFSNKLTSFLAWILGREQLYSSEFMQANYFGALIQLMFALSVTMMCFFYLYNAPIECESANRVSVFYKHILMLWITFLAVGMRVEILNRLSYYFGIIVILIVPYVFSRIKRKERFWVMILFCIVCIAYFIIIGVYRPQWHGSIPYEFNIEGVSQVFYDIFH